MSITLNGIVVAVPKADGGVKEEQKQIFHQRMLVDGSLVRHFYGLKKWVTLSWDALVPVDYQTILGQVTAGATITYVNTNSAYTGGSFSFTGFPMHTEDTYLPGSTLLRSLTVQIQEE